ncbi:MAG: mRNA surveillance protein pelota [Candidatus Bilamarchaeaceae archaeon]
MQVIYLNRRTGEAKIKTDVPEDLWHLSKVVEIGDNIEATSFRSVNINGKEDRKKVHLLIGLEAVEFMKSVNRLRLRGKIISGTPEEFVQKGRYHSIDVEAGESVKIVKPSWKEYLVKRLKEAEKESKKPSLRIIVLDEEHALLAKLRAYGVDVEAEIRFHGSKKGDDYSEKESEYFGELTAEVEKHPERYVIAGPGFTKDNLKKFMNRRKPELVKRVIWETCSNAEESGINELFKRKVLEKIAGEERLQKESALMEELLTALNKDTGLAVYGIEETRKAADGFAIEKLLVLDEYLRTSKDAEAVVDLADRNRAEIIVFSEEGDPGQQLKGLGKIAGLLKFRMR